MATHLTPQFPFQTLLLIRSAAFKGDGTLEVYPLREAGANGESDEVCRSVVAAVTAWDDYRRDPVDCASSPGNQESPEAP